MIGGKEERVRTVLQTIGLHCTNHMQHLPAPARGESLAISMKRPMVRVNTGTVDVASPPCP